MLSLLSRAYHFVTGAISGLWHKVVSLVTAVYSFIDRWIGILERDVSVAYDWSVNAIRIAYRDVARLYSWADTAIHDVFGELYRYIISGLDFIRRYVDTAIADISRYIDIVRAWIVNAFNSIERWIIRNIWEPLDNAITSAIRWIDHEGMALWDVISHPQKLFSWIASYVWKSWLDILTQWSIPIVGYILKRSIPMAPRVLSLIEDLIVKVF